MTVVKGKNDELPREEGRHNTLWMVEYFASQNYHYTPSDIHFKNCVFDNIKGVLYYKADANPLQCATHWGELTLENVRFTDLKETAIPMADAREPFTIRMKNVVASFQDTDAEKSLIMVLEDSNTTIIED